MTRLTKSIATGSAALGLGLGGFGVASALASAPSTAPAASDDDAGEANDSDTPLEGTDLEMATAAALAHTGGGEVTETEVGDDGAAFGVEIRLDDGSQVEVNLDADFNVVGSEIDDD